MGSQVERTHSKVVVGGLGWARLRLVEHVVVLYSCADKLGGTTGE